MFEVLFSIIYQLSKAYPSLNPISLDEMSYHKVIRLYADTRRIQMTEKKLSDPNRVIRRKAGDDWF